MKTSLTLGISSISISVLFWALIIFANVAQVGGDGSTAIAVGLAWFFLGCPLILGLSIAALVTAFKKPRPIQGGVTPPPMKTAKIISVISAALLIAPFLYGTVGTTLLNS